MDSNILIEKEGLIRKTKIPMQELEPKVEGGLCARGGIIAGLYGIYIYKNKLGCHLCSKNCFPIVLELF